MSTEALVRDAIHDGLILAPTERGTLRVGGPKEAVEKWAPILKEHKAELLAELRKGVHGVRSFPQEAAPTHTVTNRGDLHEGPDSVLGVHGVLGFQPKPIRTICHNSPEVGQPAMGWEEWQAAHPSPGTVPLNKAEKAHILAWLEFIGETDASTIADVLQTCERYPDTRAHCLREARNAGARRIIAARVAKEAAEERAGILEHEAGLARTEAERVSKLAEAFYNHLWGPGMATNCCHGRTGKYCAEGRKLRDAYYEAAKSAGKLA